VAAEPLTPLPERPAPGPPREDLSPTLRTFLVEWVEKRLIDPREAGQRVFAVAIAANVPMIDGYDVLGSVEAYWRRGDDQLLDVVHATLHVLHTDGTTYRYPPHVEVERHLAYGRSVWQATESGLVRRVDAIAQAAFDRVTETGDDASENLREAWDKAYSRDSDASDAWDHAIKAVEAVLRPIVCPNHKGATLGNVIGDLRSQGHLWKLLLRGRARDHSVQPLVDMLELMWPDPNRHGSPTPEPPATLEEARAVVNLAVTIVQWGRDGQIVRK